MAYIQPGRLRELVKEAKRLKTLTPELADVVRNIVNGLYARYRLQGPEQEDMEQEALLLVSLKLHLINVNGSIFNFLTTIVFNHWRAMNRTIQNLKKKQRALAMKMKNRRWE